MISRKNKRFKLLILGLVILLFISSFPKASSGIENFIFEPYAKIVKYASGKSTFDYVERLTEKDFEGRQSGSEGCNKAARWIADEFKMIGLKPFEPTSYFQPIEVPYFNYLPPLHFQYLVGNNWVDAIYRKDFIPDPNSSEGTVSNKCVFVGYGIHAPEAFYDDYKDVSVVNKTVLMLYNLPEFINQKELNQSLLSRFDTAKSLGASSIVLLLQSEKNSTDLFKRKFIKLDVGKIPVILSHTDLSHLLIQQSGQNLDDIVRKMEKTQKPTSFSMELDLKIEIHIVSEKRISNNVIGYIPSADPEVKDSLLITSHYDALGIDLILNKIYQGANDNASSTGVILEVARALTQNNCLPSINIVFISFTGEEQGLLGSIFYVQHPLFPLNKIKAVINSEFLGTMDGENVAGTSRTIFPELGRLISASAKYQKIKFLFVPELLIPVSDHYPFFKLDVPTVMFVKASTLSGYPEYHTMEDTISIINPVSLELFSQLITLMTLSYSKSAFFDFSNFPSDSKTTHPFLVYVERCYLPVLNDYKVFINSHNIGTSLTESLKLFFLLIAGENKIEIEIKYKDKTWIDYRFVLSCDPDPNLRGDFNQDFKVDLADLMLLSKKMDISAVPYQYDSLFDLNQDQEISMLDYWMFSNYFGYSKNPQGNLTL